MIPIPSQSLARCSEISARSKVPLGLAESLGVLPLTLRNDEILVVATSKERALEVERNLKFYTSLKIEIHLCDESFLFDAIHAAYKGCDQFLSELVAVNDQTEAKKPELWGSSDSKTITLLEALIDYALVLEASDLHLCPTRDGVFAKLRIRGEIRSTSKPVFSLSQFSQVVRRLKVLAGLKTTGLEVQDGRFELKDRSIRASFVPSLHGEKVALRFFSSVSGFDFNSLGFSAEKKESIRQAISSRDGMIVVSGPTGSGKTTTLYSLVEFLSHLNVVSIEDPPERIIPNITQIPVSESLSFAKGLKAILRQDPDVILIGEIRDAETAKIASQAASTGHLVLCSLHSGSIDGVIKRFEQLGVSGLNFRSIIVQRLVPTLCEKCKVIDLNASNIHKCKIFRRAGCSLCDYTGYSGRSLISEISGIDESFETQWNQLYFSGKVEVSWNTGRMFV